MRVVIAEKEIGVANATDCETTAVEGRARHSQLASEGKITTSNELPAMSPTPVLSAEEVAVAFRLAFHQEPRPEDIEWHRRHWTFDQMRSDFLSTAKFWILNHSFIRGGPRILGVVLDNGLAAFIDTDDLYVGPGMMAGNWEPRETAFMRRMLKPGSVMLDIGAMMGWFTLQAAHLVGPKGHVLAFEPQPHMHALLRRSVLANRLDSYVHTYELALSDAPGHGKLKGNVALTGEPPANKGHVWVQPAADVPLDSPLVRLARLDDLDIARKVDFIKIDVEGGELRALQGGARTIRAHRPVIMAELFPEQMAAVGGGTPAELITLMRDWGYSAFALTPDGTPRAWKPADVPNTPNGYTTIVFQ